jgi:hypothetical protein
VDDLLAALEELPLSLTIKQSVWIYPAAEFLHIVGFVLLVGSAVAFDLRLLGLSRAISVRALAGHLLPWAQVGLAIIVPTGVTMFLNEPTTMAANPAFRVKLVLVALGIANALSFRWPFRAVDRWDRDTAAPGWVRLNAVFSLLIWFCTLAAGRLIAYI